MQPINDGQNIKRQDIGRFDENSSDFSFGQRTVVAWKNNLIKVRIPWTLVTYNPIQMKVIDGALSYDGV